MRYNNKNVRDLKRKARRAGRTGGCNTDHQEGCLDRRHLLANNLDRIEQTYRDARACGMDEPVVICGEATDPTLRRITEERYGAEAAEHLIQYFRSKRQTPTIHFAFPRARAR